MRYFSALDYGVSDMYPLNMNRNKRAKGGTPN